MNCAITSLLLVLLWIATLLTEGTYELRQAWPLYLFTVPIAAVVGCGLIYATLRCLCQIEHAGIRFWGNRRSARITKPVADVVIGHASFGWVLGGLITVALSAAMNEGDVLFIISKTPDILGVSPWTFAPFSPVIVGLFIGLLTFEWLAFRGVQACRFANPPDASLEPVASDQSG